MAAAIVSIQTTTGPVAIKGEQITELFLVSRNPAGRWTVTHTRSGYLVAAFHRKEDAVSVAVVLQESRADFEWDQPTQMPLQTKEVVHRIFSVLSRSIQFAKQVN